MTNFYSRFKNYILLQSGKLVIKVKYLLFKYFWSGVAMYALLWLNTVAAVWLFFNEHIFVFLVTLFLKKMRIIISANNPHYHSRLSKPILKILSINRKNILGKQFTQAIWSKYVFRLLHALKFQVFSAKLNMTVKVVKLFTGVLWENCSDEFYRKRCMRVSQ